MRKLFGSVAVALVLLVGATVQAESASDRVVYKKKTVIDLSGANIEGELTKPEGTYIVNRKLSRFSTLITLRENFTPELLISHDNL
jgi:hypothetical protein